MKKQVTIRASVGENIPSRPLTVFSLGIQTAMLVNLLPIKPIKNLFDEVSNLRFVWSRNGFDFTPDDREIVILNSRGRHENINDCFGFSIARISQGFVLTYIRKENVSHFVKIEKNKPKNSIHSPVKETRVLITAYSKNLYDWVIKTIEETDSHSASFVYDSSIDRYIQYRDGLFLRQKSSPRFGHWPLRSSLLGTARYGQFDSYSLTIMGSLLIDRGIILVYDASVTKKSDTGEHTLIQAGMMLLDKKYPDKVLWRSQEPLFQSIIEHSKNISVVPLGIVYHKNIVRLYWLCNNGVILVESLPTFFQETPVATANILYKSFKNPIISPSLQNSWEFEGTFNPGAFQDDTGRVHLLYRAIGSDGISRIGYASSIDGVHVNYRCPYPVFEQSWDSKRVLRAVTSGLYNPAVNVSGGGWGGAEDPRVVRIGDTIYMMYIAFEGWNSVRIALTSISVSDFLHEKWTWKKSVLISSPNQVNKNWLLFPEKIDGKYAILHSIAPDISIEYIDNLDNFTGQTFIVSSRKGGPQPGPKGSWDGLLRGGGPPPVKTDLGWLLLYHALDSKDVGKYKLGAMILDFADPTKVLYRSKQPILSPDEVYENNGKPGVIYASGAIVRGDTLFVYYGGADRVVCVATTPMKDLLEYMVHGSNVSSKNGFELKKGSLTI